MEAGKKAAAANLALQRQIVKVLEQSDEPLDLGAIADAVNAPDQLERIYLILRHLVANDRGIEQLGDPAQPSQLQFRWQH